MRKGQIASSAIVVHPSRMISSKSGQRHSPESAEGVREVRKSLFRARQIASGRTLRYGVSNRVSRLREGRRRRHSEISPAEIVIHDLSSKLSMVEDCDCFMIELNSGNKAKPEYLKCRSL
jgi:hypothetical protein